MRPSQHQTPQDLAKRAAEFDAAWYIGHEAAQNDETSAQIAQRAAALTDPAHRRAFHAGVDHVRALQEHSLDGIEERNDLTAASLGALLEAPDNAARRAIHAKNDAAAQEFAGPVPVARRSDGSLVAEPPVGAGTAHYQSHYERVHSHLAAQCSPAAEVAEPARERRVRTPEPPDLSL